MLNDQFVKNMLFLFILALLVRALGIVIWPSVNTGPDTNEYLVLAQNMKFHGSFSFGGPHAWGVTPLLNSPGPYEPTAARAPLYPLLIASLWWSDEPPVLEVKILQAILGGLIVLLTYSIARALLPRRTGLVAGLLMALSPLSCLLTASVLSETLFTFLLTLAIWLWSKQRGWAAGAFLGLAALTRPVMLPFIILLAICAVIFSFNRRVHIAIVAAAMLVIAPWTVRNIVTMQALVPIQTQGWGANLLFGTVDIPYGSNNNVWTHFGADPVIHAIISSEPVETQAERKMLHAALARILADPGDWIWLRLKQYPRLFADPGMYLVKVTHLPPPIVKVIMIGCSFLFMALALFGAFLVRKRWRQFYVLAAFPLFMFIIQFPAYGDARFLAPILPLLAIFAAIPLTATGNERVDEGRIARSHGAVDDEADALIK